jgi:hypothetical protein
VFENLPMFTFLRDGLADTHWVCFAWPAILNGVGPLRAFTPQRALSANAA